MLISTQMLPSTAICYDRPFHTSLTCEPMFVL